MFTFFSKPKPQRGGGLADPIIPGVPCEDRIAGGDPTNRPSRFSLREKMPKPGVQMNWDCVGWAGAYLKEFLEREETGTTPDLSGLFIYARAKQNDGYPLRGTLISHATYIPEKFGVALEIDYPEVNLPSDPGGMPVISDELATLALKYKSKSSVMVERGDQQTFEGIKQALWKWKRPIIVGADWYENSTPDRNGVLPSIKGKVIYGHCTAVCGYDDGIGIEFINSYGEYWGDHGFGWYPHGFPVYATAWTAIDLPNDWQKPVLPETAPTTTVNPEPRRRDLLSEQRNALKLQQAIYAAFSPQDVARPYAGRNWAMLVEAVTYFGYSTTDLVNWLYAFTHKRQTLWDLSKPRPK